MLDALLVSLVTLSGMLVTLGLYYILSVNWPRLYFGPSDGLEIFLSSRFAIFAGFRIVPVAIISSATFTYTSMITDDRKWLPPTLFMVAYGMFVLVSRLANRVKHGRRLNLPDTLWIFTSVSLAAFGVLIGSFASPLLASLAPTPGALRDAVFTAVLVAATLGAAQRFGLSGDYSERAIKRAINESNETTRTIETQSRKRNIDRRVISAIYIAGQLQRPRWFQGIERVLYSLGAPVTTGAFQYRDGHTKPRSSEITRYLDRGSASNFASMYGGLGEQRGHQIATMTFGLHNSAKPFVDLCHAVHAELIRQEFNSSYALSWIHAHGLEVGELRLHESYPYNFVFSIHSRIDTREVVQFTLGVVGSEEGPSKYKLLPGETIQIEVHRHLLGQKWRLQVEGDESPAEQNRFFIPLDALNFNARWEG